MMIPGPGKYDEQCERMILETKADMVLLIVCGGNNGTGFSINAKELHFMKEIPRVLRDVANDVEAQNKAREN